EISCIAVLSRPQGERAGRGPEPAATSPPLAPARNRAAPIPSLVLRQPGAWLPAALLQLARWPTRAKRPPDKGAAPARSRQPRSPAACAAGTICAAAALARDASPGSARPSAIVPGRPLAAVP